MINAIIEFSARNRVLVFLLVAVAVVIGVWSIKTVPLDAIPDLSDTQVIVYSRWDRSPDIVEDQVTYPIVTAMLGAPTRQGRSRLLRFRLLVRLHRLRRRHRHLLGALAHDGIPVGRLAAAPARRAHGAGTGRHRRRLGLPIRPGRYHRPAQSGRAAFVSRLGVAVLPEGGAGRRRGGAARGLRPPVPGPGRSQSPARLQHADREGHRRRAGRQQRRRRTPRRDDRRRIHGARSRVREVGGRYRRDRARAQRRAACPCASAMWAPSRSAPTCGAGSPI